MKGVVMGWTAMHWNTLLQTWWFPALYPSNCCRDAQKHQVPDCLRCLASLRAFTKWENQKEKDNGGAESKGRRDRTAQKIFADWILNTVVEVTIYLMPAKLARTSGAGYLVQLFMISSKI